MRLITPRWKAALRYLGWADKPHKWRISRALCPSCEGRHFISFGQSAFMTRCLSCGANVTNLSLIPAITLHTQHHPVNVAWEMSTYGATLQYMRKKFPLVLESEYFPGAPPGEVINDTRNEDVQNLSFEDNSIDLITSNQVFEHVSDDIKGYEECYRVLRKNGAVIFTVPLHDIPRTEMLAEVVGNEVVHHSQPEYHDSRIAGPRSALTFWRHSVNDICERVESAGFTARLLDVTIPPSQTIPIKVIYAVKT